MIGLRSITRSSRSFSIRKEEVWRYQNRLQRDRQALFKVLPRFRESAKSCRSRVVSARADRSSPGPPRQIGDDLSLAAIDVPTIEMAARVDQSLTLRRGLQTGSYGPPISRRLARAVLTGRLIDQRSS
jgi:hypothetical protein